MGVAFFSEAAPSGDPTVTTTAESDRLGVDGSATVVDERPAVAQEQPVPVAGTSAVEDLSPTHRQLLAVPGEELSPAARKFLEDPGVLVHHPEIQEQWVVAPVTSAQRLRRCPRASSALLCMWMANLLLGQLATTIWWLVHFSAWDLLCGIAVCGMLCAGALVRLTPLQVLATTVSLTLTFLPVLNVYSAVALFFPPSGDGRAEDCGCWEVLHMPTFAGLAVMYFAEALPPVLKAEYGEHPRVQKVVHVLSLISCLDRFFYAIVVVVYTVAVLFVGSPRLCKWTSQPPTCETVGPLAGRGLVLALHGLGLAAGEMYRLTVATHGEDMHRFLLVAGQALAKWLRGTVVPPSTTTVALIPPTVALVSEAVPPATANTDVCKNIVDWFREELELLTRCTQVSASSQGAVSKVQTLSKRMRRLWDMLEVAVPMLRAAAPPAEAVALLVALQRAAPLLAPAIVVLIQLEQSTLFPRVALILGVSIVVLVFWEAKNQTLNIPQSSLRRLALLVPNFYIDASTRTTMGWSLSAVKNVQQSNRGIARLMRMPGEALQSFFRSVPWPVL